MKTTSTQQQSRAQPPVRSSPASQMQSRANASTVVRHLGTLQAAADDYAATRPLQLFRKSTVAGQDGYFVPGMTSPIHCHVGNKMRDPHLKIRSVKYPFGNPISQTRQQEAYDALVGTPVNAALDGYDDCEEYLRVDQECIDTRAEDDSDDETPDPGGRPQSAYDDPTTKASTKALIERGLAQNQYPPR